MSLFKLIVSIVFNVAIFAIPSVLARRHSGLVACLGDCRPGFVGGLASVVSLSHGHRALLEERLKPPVQKGQPLADKILLLLLFAAFLGLIVFTSLDVFRFHIMAELGTVVSSLGPVLFVAGWWIAYLSLREDAFASQVVRHQQERNQAVVDTGV
jgi:protein-S-isoprenylcysteine O-methyltransferase Ste14